MPKVFTSTIFNGAYKKFTVDYGIDTEAGPKASATFEIYGDTKALFISQKMGRYDMPRHIEWMLPELNSWIWSPMTGGTVILMTIRTGSILCFFHRKKQNCFIVKLLHCYENIFASQ